MARITYYKNSFLASIVSIAGSGALILGVFALLDGSVGEGILCIVVGIALMGLASIISENKAFKQWWKQVENANLVPEIAKSTETAVAVYKKNPQKRTLEKIRELNPAAANYIEQSLAANK